MCGEHLTTIIPRACLDAIKKEKIDKEIGSSGSTVFSEKKIQNGVGSKPVFR